MTTEIIMYRLRRSMSPKGLFPQSILLYVNILLFVIIEQNAILWHYWKYLILILERVLTPNFKFSLVKRYH